jgi:excisionase family DNA binding protein
VWWTPSRSTASGRCCAPAAGAGETDAGEPCDCPDRPHLEDWRADLRAKGTSAKQVGQVTGRARKVIDGCGFVFMADLSASKVQKFLEGLREQGRRVVLDPGQEWYTKAELAAVLGVKPSAVNALVRHRRLRAEGQGRRRRFPRETAEALAEAAGRGRSVQTSNFYLGAVKQFCTGWSRTAVWPMGTTRCPTWRAAT